MLQRKQSRRRLSDASRRLKLQPNPYHQFNSNEFDLFVDDVSTKIKRGLRIIPSPEPEQAAAAEEQLFEPEASAHARPIYPDLPSPSQAALELVDESILMGKATSAGSLLVNEEDNFSQSQSSDDSEAEELIDEQDDLNGQQQYTDGEAQLYNNSSDDPSYGEQSNSEPEIPNNAQQPFILSSSASIASENEAEDEIQTDGEQSTASAKASREVQHALDSPMSNAEAQLQADDSENLNAQLPTPQESDAEPNESELESDAEEVAPSGPSVRLQDQQTGDNPQSRQPKSKNPFRKPKITPQHVSTLFETFRNGESDAVKRLRGQFDKETEDALYGSGQDSPSEQSTTDNEYDLDEDERMEEQERWQQIPQSLKGKGRASSEDEDEAWIQNDDDEEVHAFPEEEEEASREDGGSNHDQQSETDFVRFDEESENGADSEVQEIDLEAHARETEDQLALDDAGRRPPSNLHLSSASSAADARSDLSLTPLPTMPTTTADIQLPPTPNIADYLEFPSSESDEPESDALPPAIVDAPAQNQQPDAFSRLATPPNDPKSGRGSPSPAVNLENEASSNISAQNSPEDNVVDQIATDDEEQHEIESGQLPDVSIHSNDETTSDNVIQPSEIIEPSDDMTTDAAQEKETSVYDGETDTEQSRRQSNVIAPGFFNVDEPIIFGGESVEAAFREALHDPQRQAHAREVLHTMDATDPRTQQFLQMENSAAEEALQIEDLLPPAPHPNRPKVSFIDEDPDIDRPEIELERLPTLDEEAEAIDHTYPEPVQGGNNTVSFEAAEPLESQDSENLETPIETAYSLRDQFAQEDAEVHVQPPSTSQPLRSISPIGGIEPLPVPPVDIEEAPPTTEHNETAEVVDPALQDSQQVAPMTQSEETFDFEVSDEEKASPAAKRRARRKKHDAQGGDRRRSNRLIAQNSQEEAQLDLKEATNLVPLEGLRVLSPKLLSPRRTPSESSLRSQPQTSNAKKNGSPRKVHRHGNARARVAVSSPSTSAPVTRSHCHYCKLSVTTRNGTTIFAVPECSMAGRKEEMLRSRAESGGEVSTQEHNDAVNLSKIQDGQIDADATAALARIVGTDLLHECDFLKAEDSLPEAAEDGNPERSQILKVRPIKRKRSDSADNLVQEISHTTQETPVQDGYFNRFKRFFRR